MDGMRPIHPGEIVREEYLLPLELSVNALAKVLHVPATRIHEIVKENRSITPRQLYQALERYKVGLGAQNKMRQY
jgi:addiction module HigA family antidote